MGKKKGKGKSGQDDPKKSLDPAPQEEEKLVPQPSSSGLNQGTEAPQVPSEPSQEQKKGNQPSKGADKTGKKQKGAQQQSDVQKTEEQPRDTQPSSDGQQQKGNRPASAPNQKNKQPKGQHPATEGVASQSTGNIQKNEQKQHTQGKQSKQASGNKQVHASGSAPVMSAEQKTNIDKLSQKMQLNLNFDAISQKSKKGGTKGRLCKIETNYLKLKLGKLKKEAYHYDVEFTPEKVPKRFYVLAMQKFRLKYFPTKYPAFDGRKNLYSALPLIDSRNKSPVMEGEVTIEDENNRSTEFKIKIQYAATIDLTTLDNYMSGQNMEKPQRAIQCLDIVFRHAPSLEYTRVGRSFFTPPLRNSTIKLTGGMELWHGIFQSAILGSEPFLNVDVANKAFPIEQSVTDLLKELMDTGFRDRGTDFSSALHTELRNDVSDKLKQFIKGLKIKYQIPQKATSTRISKVINVVGSARREKFKLNDNQEMTVEEYFRKEKDYKLQYPHLPCLHVGNPNKKVYYPAELCSIVAGQVINKKLNEEQTTKMIRQTATSTYDRKAKIMSTVDKLKYNDNLCMKEFGLQVEPKFVEVNARVLDPPDLRYSHNIVRPQDGTWRPNKFFISSNLIQWTILNLDYRVRKEELKRFEEMVKESGIQMGMTIQNPVPSMSLDIDRSRPDDVDRYFMDCAKKQIDLVFIVLPSQRTSDVYCQMKQKAELRHGVLTQCIKSKTMNKMNRSTVSNILLKVNAKLNGTNHIFKEPPPILKNEPCMIVGADVTHPSPDQQAVPSVAAVAASCDLNGAVYNFHWSLQHPTVEIIEDLGNIIKKQIMQFREKTKKVPTSILFFRDGVSEGQFSEVRHKEISAIEKACFELSPKYRPRITFLVVQKRHHTRFFPTRPQDGDKNGNVPPGTCVDSVITFPNKMDFYLCSHASLQGVSRPTRYCVLLNEHNFVEDDIEELTYYLCHLFTRCTRSVSYPAPTYYAHLAAFRARNYLNGNQIDMGNLKATEERFLIQNNFHKNSPMFFV